MATKGQSKAASSRAALRWQLGLGLTLVGGLGGLAGCTDRLPGFADPPPVDAGGDSGGDDNEAEDGG
jgi:hypothetical protein